MSASLGICRIDLDAMLDYFYNHLIPCNVRSVPVGDPWVVAFGRIQWLYNVSHINMTLDVAGAPPRSTHQKIL